jgi:glycosyltransferase involved in cell wall biosynthesis
MEERDNLVGDSAPAIQRGHPRVSAAIIAYNEERDLPGCLETLSWCDDMVVVVDDKSTDDTAAVARKYTEKVFVRPWPGWSAQKNFAFDQCMGDWILSVDADEQIPAQLREEILEMIRRPDAAVGYFIPRRNIWIDQWLRHGGWYPDYTLRLFRKGRGTCRYRVHERIEVDGPTGVLKTPLDHYNIKRIDEHIQTALRATEAEAEEMLENGVRFCWLPPVGLVKAFVRDALRGPRDSLTLYLLAKRTFKNRFVLIWALPFLPHWKFFRMYVLKLGFLDGLRGLLVAALSAMYVVLKYAKYWEKRWAAKPIGLRDQRDQSAGRRPG